MRKIPERRSHDKMTSSGKLPQWWLDSTPHDTLEDHVERKEKEAAERKAKEKAKKDEDKVGDPLDAPGVKDMERSQLTTSRTKGRIRRSPTRGDDSTYDYETTNYSEERAKLKPVAVADDGDLDQAIDDSLGREGENVKPIGSPAYSETGILSPMSETSCTSDVPVRLKERKFKTAFTGAGAFDFAMQQRAQEKERREKERLAREALKQHSAASLEAIRVHQQKQRDLEEKRKKKEAEENLKGFKNLALDSRLDKSTELRQQKLEDKRQKKEAEEKRHEYKSTA